MGSVLRARTRRDEEEPCWGQAVAGKSGETCWIGDGPGKNQVRLFWGTPVLYATAHDRDIGESQFACCLSKKVGASTATLHQGDRCLGESDGQGDTWKSGTGPHIDDLFMRHTPNRGAQREGGLDVALHESGKVLV